MGKKKRRKLPFPFLALVTALIFFVAIFGWWQWSLLPVEPSSDSSQLFVIQKREDLSSVARRLKEEGLIRSSFGFKILVLLKGISGKIQAGDFRLKSSMTPEELAQFLTHGSLDVWLTFPEGWRREEIARRLVANLEGFDEQEFLTLTTNLEGYLFPDTYLVPKDATSQTIMAIFQNNFEKQWPLELKEVTRREGLTQKQVLILASVVEREARHGEDRPIIAGILLKRWRDDWPLQTDATIQYAIASAKCKVQSAKCEWWPKKLTKTDLEIDSPYNTYQYKGLPPAPICNPGLASIEAVVYPQETPYWFYLSDREGEMHYAETVEEHNENISRYLR